VKIFARDRPQTIGLLNPAWTSEGSYLNNIGSWNVPTDLMIRLAGVEDCRERAIFATNTHRRPLPGPAKPWAAAHRKNGPTVLSFAVPRLGKVALPDFFAYNLAWAGVATQSFQDKICLKFPA
jgi:hypothetical protein